MLKKGRWRQMGEVGGRCSQKNLEIYTAAIHPPARALARPPACKNNTVRSEPTYRVARIKNRKGGGGGGGGGVKTEEDEKGEKILQGYRSDVEASPCLPSGWTRSERSCCTTEPLQPHRPRDQRMEGLFSCFKEEQKKV